jgi:hypothetical protein
MLQRQIIREATVDQLYGRTAAGPRVYPTPILPWRRERPLPAIGVYTLREGSESLGESGPFQLRQTLELAIEVITETETPPDVSPEARLLVDAAAPLDALCEEIEAALLANRLWYQHFENVAGWESRQELARVDESDRRTAAATITARVTFTCIHEPVIPDRFLRMHIDVDLIDPAADPNTTGHPTEPPDGYPGGYPGPDGRIEARFDLPKPGDPPLWPNGIARKEG